MKYKDIYNLFVVFLHLRGQVWNLVRGPHHTTGTGHLPLIQTKHYIHLESFPLQFRVKLTSSHTNNIN